MNERTKELHDIGSREDFAPDWNKILRVYTYCCAFRLVNAAILDTYFDPDEYYQMVEPAYCLAFFPENYCPAQTWEWKRIGDADNLSDNLLINFVMNGMLGPARTYTSILPLTLFYSILRFTGMDSTYMIADGPRLLHAITMAAPIDTCVWYIGYWLQGKRFANFCLFFSLFSWFNAFTLVRSFANVQETLAVTLTAALTVRQVVQGHPPTTLGQYVRSAFGFFLGGIAVSIRGTAVTAFLPFGLMLSLRQPTLYKKFEYVLLVCALPAVTGLILSICIDRFYFGFWAVPMLGNLHFNLVENKAILYGDHPWHWYFSVGIPVISGLLLPLVLTDLIRLKPSSPAWKRCYWVTAIFYLVALSISQHKEFRYILPVLPFFCIFAANQLNRGTFGGPSKLRAIFFIFSNAVAFVYLGRYHQSGAIHANRFITNDIRTRKPIVEETIRIDYMTGECHTMPMHSQLHVPPYRFDTRTLDCSPDCRADPATLCETDAFRQDSAQFLTNEYRGAINSSCEDIEAGENSGICTSEVVGVRDPPNYLVTFSEHVPSISDHLRQYGMEEIGRRMHQANGIRMFGYEFGKAYREGAFRHLVLIPGIELSVRDAVVYRKSI